MIKGKRIELSFDSDIRNYGRAIYALKDIEKRVKIGKGLCLDFNLNSPFNFIQIQDDVHLRLSLKLTSNKEDSIRFYYLLKYEKNSGFNPGLSRYDFYLEFNKYDSEFKTKLISLMNKISKNYTVITDIPGVECFYNFSYWYEEEPDLLRMNYDKILKYNPWKLSPKLIKMTKRNILIITLMSPIIAYDLSHLLKNSIPISILN